MLASLTLTGDKRLQKQLKALGQAARGQALLRALNAGALPIVTDAKGRAPVDTGTLRRSLHVDDEVAGGNYAELNVGTNVEYARRIELGFDGTDSLGRTFHQPAQPYLRPALESQKGAAEREIADALRALIREAVA